MTGLLEGQRVIVTLPGGAGLAHGVITSVFEKSYAVLLDGETESQPFAQVKVKPESNRRPTAPLSPLKVEMTPWPAPILTIERLDAVPVRALPKPELPEKCPPWIAFVQRQPCCNCGSSDQVEAHHEGKKGHAQKVRDTMAVPLCKVCHTVYTLRNVLPDPEATRLAGELRERTRELSLEILRNAQEHLLVAALQLLEQRDRIEVMSKGIAKILRPGALDVLLNGVETPIQRTPFQRASIGEIAP